MIGLIQRVSNASVNVNGEQIAAIDRGCLLLLGVEKGDSREQVEKLAKKVASIRIFEDDDGKMNLSLQDIDAELLVVSQFTLAADTKKGNRPGFSNAAEPTLGNDLYEYFLEYYRSQYTACQHGEFGANMQVQLVNDGPATFYLQT